MADIRVKVGSENKIKVIPTLYGIKMSNILDVNIPENNKKDKYVMVFDATLNKYTLVNPDEVLSAASTTESTSPGLPSDFLNELDIELDDRINLDAGLF